MSFSKAKIQRFNDIKDCTPSPAKYNVTNQEKVKLGIISKPGTYLKKTGSPQSSECSSLHSTPCFQTPTLPVKKKKLLGMSFKTSTKNADLEELREKIVECNNKDLYIKDLTEQLEDMTEKINNLQQENRCLKNEKEETEVAFVALKKQNDEDNLQRFKKYSGISNDLEEVSKELKNVKREHEDLKNQNFVELSKLLAHIELFQQLYNKTVEENRRNLEKKVNEFRQKEDETKRSFVEKLEKLKTQHNKEKEELVKKLEESEAKICLLEENFKEVNLLTELQMQQKIDEIEDMWKQKLENKEKEAEAILKECQAIGEYSIIQCEMEKNQIKKQLEEKEKEVEEILTENEKLEEELGAMKTEKHAYELSVATFKDTIEVLKKRLFDSDRDVEQFKEELATCEEKILNYERKCTELTNQLHETQQANEELEMQYESTSKLMESQVRNIEAQLLAKIESSKLESKELVKDRELLNEVLTQHHEQQDLISKAQATIAETSSYIETLEKKMADLEVELKLYKSEAEETAEIRKKYIEKSGKHDELAQQFEQVLQELDEAKDKIKDLEKLIGPYQEQLEAYQQELKLLNNEKHNIEAEAKELGLKYAQILGHQNHKQKIKHVTDLKVKSSELFQKNIDLESKNYKLNKIIEKLMKENDDLRKTGKKVKISEDKENMGSPKCIKGTQSPGPLKERN